MNDNIKHDYLWVALGDIHDDFLTIKDIPELADADGIIISGDITMAGGVKQAKHILNKISEINPNVMAQIGNMDRGEVTNWLEEKGWNIHCKVKEIAPDLVVFGVGTSTFTPFATPSEFPESTFATWLEKSWETARKYKKTILVSHNPPANTLCDLIHPEFHVGSTAVREFIEEAQPDICICGHIHEARSIDQIGRTIIINHGAFSAGGYIVIRLNHNELSVELRVLNS